MNLFDSLRLKLVGVFKGQKQTITGNTGHVVAAQSRGGPANAGVTITPVIEKLLVQPAETVEAIEKKIARMVETQNSTAGSKPGGILVDEREFAVLLRDLRPGDSHGLLTVHKETKISYESVVTYDGIVVNRIAGLGLETPKK